MAHSPQKACPGPATGPGRKDVRKQRARVTPLDMRLFGLECLRWAEQAADASQRDLMLRVATSWMNTAAAIEGRVGNGDASALPDLRTKLD